MYAFAGKPFNINSPQQLAQVLFEDLKVPAPVRMGKGKVFSTAADVLEDLSDQYPIASKVLEFRQIAKLKGTYVDALPALVDPKTGRIHTTFNQTGAATGRLSRATRTSRTSPSAPSSGREIRRAFVPRAGWQTARRPTTRRSSCACSPTCPSDPVLIEAFRHGEDIHTRTAAEVFGVPARGDPGACGAAPRPSTSASSTARARSGWPRRSASIAREADAIHRGLLRALQPASASASTRPSPSPPDRREINLSVAAGPFPT